MKPALTKKERIRLERQRRKMERALGGIKDMRSLPDVMFVIAVDHEDIAIREARKLGIPVVAVVDTNCSPDGVDYIIPGNDDAMRAIELYTSLIAEAVLDGKASLPEVALGEDEFVELDEEGKPRKAEAPRKKKAAKKTARKTAKKAARPQARKAAPKTDAPADEGEKPAEAEAAATDAASETAAAEAGPAPAEGGAEDALPAAEAEADAATAADDAEASKDS